MKVIIQKHKQFVLGLTYVEVDEGFIKDGLLHYIPDNLFDKYDTFEELLSDKQGLKKIQHKQVEGNTLEELKVKMKQAENELLNLHEAT